MRCTSRHCTSSYCFDGRLYMSELELLEVVLRLCQYCTYKGSRQYCLQLASRLFGRLVIGLFSFTLIFFFWCEGEAFVYLVGELGPQETCPKSTARLLLIRESIAAALSLNLHHYPMAEMRHQPVLVIGNICIDFKVFVQWRVLGLAFSRERQMVR